MKIHKFASAIPMMSKEEYQDMKASIKENGQRVPITMYQGQLLDGRHRYKALAELKIDPKVVQFTGSEEEAAKYVIDLNIKRRNSLSNGQRSLATINVMKLVTKAAAKEKHKKAVTNQGSKKNFSKNRKELSEPPLHTDVEPINI